LIVNDQFIADGYYQLNKGDVGLHNITILAISEDDSSNDTETVYYNAPALAPTIYDATCQDTTPVESSTTIMTAQFKIYAFGTNDNLTLPRADSNNSGTAIDGSCAITQTATYNSTVNCNMTMQYYYPPGFYDFNMSVYDTYFTQTYDEQYSALCEYLQLLSSGTADYMQITAELDDTVLTSVGVNNTGNVALTNVSIKAYDLAGQQFPSMELLASYFSANSYNNSANASQLSDGEWVQVPSLSIPVNQSASVYFFVDLPADVFPQVYFGTWYMRTEQ
jgi:hypothetical protein